MYADTARFDGSTDRRENNDTDERGELVTHVDPRSHEAGGHLIYTEQGLSPYFALLEATDAGRKELSVTFTISLDGESEKWRTHLRKKDSGFGPSPWSPNGVNQRYLETVLGDADSLPEIVLNVRPVDDGELGRLEDDPEADARAVALARDERKASFNISPRAEGLAGPGDLEGVNVTFQGGYLPLDAYPFFLQWGISSLGLDSEPYEGDPHKYSNVFDLERTVRMNDNVTGPLLGLDGVFGRIFKFVGLEEKDDAVYRANNGKCDGYFHQLRFDSAGAAALIGSHATAKQGKHYFPKHVRSDDERDEFGQGDPLAHPRIGVKFLKGETAPSGAEWLTSGGAVRWSDRDRLVRELDEALFNMISWADLPLEPDSRTYVEDAHFSGEGTTSRLELVPDPTPRLEDEQADLVTPAYANATPSGKKVLRALADGGTEPKPVGELEDETECSTATVYRAIRDAKALIESSAGNVRFKSHYLWEQTKEHLSRAKNALKLEDDESEAGEWERILAERGVRERRGEDGTEYDLGVVPSSEKAGEILLELHDFGPFRYRSRLADATIKWQVGGTTVHKPGGYTPG